MNVLKKKRVSRVLFFSLLLLTVNTTAQNRDDDFIILSYNVENLFDTFDDPETDDDAFTPWGDRHWSEYRLNKKLINLSKVILNCAGWKPPQIIALCEVENRYVLNRLLKDTSLKKFPYKIIHKDSPDPRGIDVALIYDSSEFLPISCQYISLTDTDSSVIKTREILYVEGRVKDDDTLHIYVNHWPSRYSGLMESRPKRALAAQTLRHHIEALQKRETNPKIVIVGDFNDQPADLSLLKHLKAKKTDFNNVLFADTLYNLSFQWTEKESGTLKFRELWSIFDHIIISGALLTDRRGLYACPETAEIIKLPFLFEKDERYGGVKLKRTYYGFRYTGGYSDHLSVMIKLRYPEEENY